MNSVIWLILDSCRYDSFRRARKPCIDRFLVGSGARLERRWSYASWTAPAHYAFLMGLMPHESPRGVLASTVYKEELARWSSRLGVSGIDFAAFLPQLSLVRLLRKLGWRTVGRVSLPVLNEATLLARDFDDYRLMDHHNDFAGMVEEMSFPPDAPVFYFCNLGETHYPYMLDDLPPLSGLHGAARELARGDDAIRTNPFDAGLMARLHEQQVHCVEHVDAIFGRLLDRCPPGTHIIVTADHGELFGEDGYFGHGPVMHEKVFEVPFLEGKVPPGDRDDGDEENRRAQLLQRLKGLGYLE